MRRVDDSEIRDPRLRRSAQAALDRDAPRPAAIVGDEERGRKEPAALSIGEGDMPEARCRDTDPRATGVLCVQEVIAARVIQREPPVVIVDETQIARDDL